jgi:SAM-dependent methyltransferase
VEVAPLHLIGATDDKLADQEFYAEVARAASRPVTWAPLLANPFDPAGALTIIEASAAVQRSGAAVHPQVGCRPLEVRISFDAAGIAIANNPIWKPILDLPSGYGRILRFLKVSFPNATICACDINAEGVDFCRRQFNASPVVSNTDFAKVSFPWSFDLIWSGSLLTHVSETDAIELLRLFYRSLSPNGLCVFTMHGRTSVAWLESRAETYGLTEADIRRVLSDYAGKDGAIWKLGNEAFYKRQQQIAAATKVEADESKGIKAEKAIEWKANALRHSYASYRFAQTGDAGRVAGECGNSATVIHRHYRELVKPADAERWFAVRPERPANVFPMTSQATA